MFTTLIFWIAVFSLNGNLLTDVFSINRFIDFLWPSLIIATVITGLTAYKCNIFLKRKQTSLRWAFVFFICNSIFLAGLVASAQVRKHYLIQNSAEAIGYDCMYQNPFYKSLLNVPRDFQFYSHALLVKNKITMVWSYSELKFIVVDDKISPNLAHCK